MPEVVMYLGLIGIIISVFMMFVIPVFTNSVVLPRILEFSFLIFVVSIFTTLTGAFLSSDLGVIIVNAYCKNL